MIDLSLWSQFGLAGMTIGALLWLHWRSIKGGEKREMQMRGDIATHRDECREDTGKLVTRIQGLEDRQYKDAVGMAKTCAEALKFHAETQRRQIELGVETARHAALAPKKDI